MFNDAVKVLVLPVRSPFSYVKISSSLSVSGFPKMEVNQEYYGLPPPPVGFGQPLHLSKGDIIELTRADADLPWWEVKLEHKHLSTLYSES